MLLSLPAAFAQNAPHLAYALPAGGQQGTTIQVKLGGQFLPNVTGVYVSGGGVQTKVLEHTRPMNGMQATQLRDKLQELQKKQPMDDAVRKEIADIRVKLLLFQFRRLTSPVLAETVAVEVVIAPGAEPGQRELRVATPQGLSNPLVFCIGQLREFTEKESISVEYPPAANRPGASQPPTNPNQLQIAEPRTDMPIALPAVVNGRIKPRLARPQFPPRPRQPFTPGDTDRYRFHAQGGQDLVVVASARELIPYLADAVPGWFQAVVTLYDADGKELAYNDDFRFHPDPVLHYVIPRDGEYAIEIRDALYRGREDFVYRLEIGELPFVTSAFPLGGRAGSKTNVALSGWNLPVSKVKMDNKRKGPGIYPMAVRRSNSVPFLIDNLPERLEKEPNNSATKAQRVKLPIIINGRIDQPGDWDVFSFKGRAGESIVAEVYARRLDSPLDSVLKLTDAAGKQIAFNDDFEDKGSGLETHHADSLILTTLPTSGTYYLYLGDAQQKGGPEYGYRLRISAPRPDFELRVTPSAINASGGLTVPITVYALRKDGFSGDIALALRDAPKGFALSGAIVPEGQDQVRLTLTVPPQPPGEPLTVNLEGHATIQGRGVTKLAVPAEDMMQAFAYRHLVPAKELKLALRRNPSFRVPIKVLGDEPLKIPAGGTARFRIQVPFGPAIGKLQYELSEPPPGVELKDVSTRQNGAEIMLACDASKTKPGLRGNLIVSVSAERTPPAQIGRPQPNRIRIPLGTAPAVPFEVVRQ